MELLLNNRDSFKTPPRDGADIGSEHELFLVKHMGGPTFLVDWPAKIKPFYMRTNNDDNCLVYNSLPSLALIENISIIFCRFLVLIY
jgi:asparaginyl-tRNA synthetase